MEEVTEKLDQINQTLEKHNEIAQKKLEIMKKPENKIIRILEVLMLLAGALGILTTADLIRRWLIGG